MVQICVVSLGYQKCPCIQTAGLNLIAEYNLVLLNDYTGNCDVEGPTIICGNYKSSSSVEFCKEDRNGKLGAKSVTLEIKQGFNITSSGTVKLIVGSARFGVPPSRTIVKNSASGWQVGGESITLLQGSTGANVSQDTALIGKCDNIKIVVSDLSKQLSQLYMPENTLTISNKAITFNIHTVDCNGIAVFNISSPFNDCKDRTFYLDKNGIDVKLVVINIQDSKISQTDDWVWDTKFGVNQLPNGCQSILWNMHSAPSIQLKGTICGSILAPNGTVSTSGSNELTVNGALAASTLNFKGKIKDKCMIPIPCKETCDSSTSTTTTTTTTTSICKMHL